jgi:hypothetical protein
MDHQDWPGWPEDGSHLDDGGGHLHDAGPDVTPTDDHDHHLDHLVEPVPVDHDLPPSDQDAGEPAPELAAHTEHLAATFPDDDPFAAAFDHQHDLDHLVEPVHVEPPTDADLADLPVGADPDVDPHADGDWLDGYQPLPLDLPDAPVPVDGYPWADADLIGTDLPSHGDPGGDPGAAGHPPVAELLDYNATDGPAGADAWQALLGSDDPATSALARWWAPGH